jgi:FKBP-type peptidyl-prolyl cis-trans isomerase FkpA
MFSKWPVRALTALALGGCAMLNPPRPAPKPVAYTGTPQEQWVQGQKAYEAWSAARRGWTTTPSGLQYHRLRFAPAGAARPAPGATVTIHYVGKFIDGRVFDSSRARNAPATFPLNRLIKGWQEGVPMMRVGETWEFVIPSTIAYGERDRPPIPPGSTLLFEIELIAIPPAGAEG